MKYEVVVGNIGRVLQTDNQVEAEGMYQDYVDLSAASFGRAAGQPVTLFCDGEIKKES